MIRCLCHDRILNKVFLTGHDVAKWGVNLIMWSRHINDTWRQILCVHDWPQWSIHNICHINESTSCVVYRTQRLVKWHLNETAQLNFAKLVNVDAKNSNWVVRELMTAHQLHWKERCNFACQEVLLVIFFFISGLFVILTLWLIDA